MKCFRNQLRCDIIKRPPFLVSADCVCPLSSKRKETCLTQVGIKIGFEFIQWHAPSAPFSFFVYFLFHFTFESILLSFSNILLEKLFYATGFSIRDKRGLTSDYNSCIAADLLLIWEEWVAGWNQELELFNKTLQTLLTLKGESILTI